MVHVWCGPSDAITRERRGRRSLCMINDAVFIYIECICQLGVLILAGVAGEFSSPEFVWGLLFGVHSTLALLQWQIKDPGHSAKSAGGS